MLLVAAIATICLIERSSGEAISDSTTEILALEKDYYLREGLVDGMKEAIQDSGETQTVEALSEFADFAATEFAKENISLAFWCTKSNEAGLWSSEKWGLSDAVLGICIDPLRPEEVSHVETNACSLMLAKNETSVRIAHTNGIVIMPDGRSCFYSELAGDNASVFGVSVYDEKTEIRSMGIIPEGVEIESASDD